MALVCMHNFLITDELNIQKNLRHYICDDDGLIHNDEDDNNEDDNDNYIYDNDDEAILRYHVDFNNSVQMRQTLANYFLTDAGAIPWQQTKVHVIK